MELLPASDNRCNNYAVIKQAGDFVGSLNEIGFTFDYLDRVSIRKFGCVHQFTRHATDYSTRYSLHDNEPNIRSIFEIR